MADYWGLIVVLTLILARVINTLIIRRRSQTTWQGASEPDVRGDLLILLSSDRWIRMRGYVDDLKAVTSGQWLRDAEFVEDSLQGFAKLLVFLDAALVGNARRETKVVLIALLAISAGLLGVVNGLTRVLEMKGRIVKVEGVPKSYERRLHLARELIKETGRRDWAVKMAMVPPEDGEESSLREGAAVM